MLILASLLAFLPAFTDSTSTSASPPNLCEEVYLGKDGGPIHDSTGRTLSRHCEWTGPDAPILDSEVCCELDASGAACSLPSTSSACGRSARRAVLGGLRTGRSAARRGHMPGIVNPPTDAHMAPTVLASPASKRRFRCRRGAKYISAHNARSSTRLMFLSRVACAAKPRTQPDSEADARATRRPRTGRRARRRRRRSSRSAWTGRGSRTRPAAAPR